MDEIKYCKNFVKKFSDVRTFTKIYEQQDRKPKKSDFAKASKNLRYFVLIGKEEKEFSSLRQSVHDRCIPTLDRKQAVDNHNSYSQKLYFSQLRSSNPTHGPHQVHCKKRLVTSRLGTGKPLAFFYSVGPVSGLYSSDLSYPNMATAFLQ